MSQTTITEVHEAMIAQLQAAFPAVNVAVFSPDTDFAALAPALLIELKAFPLGQDLGDRRYPANCHFSIHCVLGKDNTLLPLWELSASVAQLIYNHGIWVSECVGPASCLKVHPDRLSYQAQTTYKSRVVSWHQTLYLGEPEWAKQGVIIKEVYLGYAPGGKVPPAEEHKRIEDEQLPDF